MIELSDAPMTLYDLLDDIVAVVGLLGAWCAWLTFRAWVRRAELRHPVKRPGRPEDPK